MEGFRRLLTGLDTVQAAYFLRPTKGAAFSFEALMLAKEKARADKARERRLPGDRRLVVFAAPLRVEFWVSPGARPPALHHRVRGIQRPGIFRHVP